MTDIALSYAPDLLAADLLLEGARLASEDGLATAIILSLFSDRRARPDDRLPDRESDRRGWWGDAFPPAVAAGDDRIGSRLWLLHREKSTDETLERAKDYISEALQWLIDDGIAASIEIEAEWVEPRGPAGRLDMTIGVVRPSGLRERYQHVWQGTL
jgi:phage gp46-like protein